MLILSRKTDESIRIGNATVTVQSIHGNRVKLSIDAPPETRIDRGELRPKPEDKK